MFKRLLAIGAFVVGAFAFSASANAVPYDQVFASPSTIGCATDASCNALSHIRVRAVTYSGNAGSAVYTWTGTCASAPDAVFYIRPTGATTGCFQMDGFSTSGVPLTNALTSAHILVGNSSNVAASVAMSGTVAIDNTGATSIPLTSTNILVGNGSNVAAAVAVSGDASLANTGAFTVNSTNGKGITVTVSSIANLQALATLSGSPITTAIVTGTQGDGDTFLWVVGSLPCNAVTGGGDSGTTFCASDGAGGYLTTGYWQRQNTGAFLKDVWFGIVRDGSTNNASVFPKWLAACQGKIMLDTAGTALYSVGSTSYAPPANCQWQTVAGSVDNFTVNTSSVVLLNVINGNFSITGPGNFVFNVPSTGLSNFIYRSSDNITLKDFTIDGGMRDNGSTITTGTSRLIYINNASSTGLTIQNVTANNFQSGYSKSGSGGGCDSSTQDKTYINHLIMTGIYAFGLNFNSPCGAQTNIKVVNSSFTSASQTPLLSVSSAPIGIGFASGKDILVDGNTISGAFLDFIHFEQDVQNFKAVNNHCEVPSGVTGNANRCLDVIPANIQNAGVYLHPVHGEIAHNTANLVGSTTGSTAMAFGVWQSSAATTDVFAEDVTFHDNVAYGAWPTGFYDQATRHSATVSFHDNVADGATTGFFFYRGGSGVYNNTSKNCTTGLLYSVAQVQSHNFNGCTQTLAGSSSTSLLWIGTMRWDFAPVSLAASGNQVYELLDLDGTNTRLFGTPQATTTSTDGTSRTFNYVGGTNNMIWDGTTYANAGTLNTLTSVVTASGATSTFTHGTSGCAWGSATSCFNFTLINSAATTQSISASISIMGGAYIRKGV